MTVIQKSLGVAAAMILYALVAAYGLISEQAFDIGFYALIAASVVLLGSGRPCSAAGN
ncbi:MAG: hypothetical protein V4696_10500 [Pseudomonadota bacterium]